MIKHNRKKGERELKDTFDEEGHYMGSNYHRDELFFDWIPDYCREHGIKNVKCFKAYVFLCEYFKEAIQLDGNYFSERSQGAISPVINIVLRGYSSIYTIMLWPESEIDVQRSLLYQLLDKNSARWEGINDKLTAYARQGFPLRPITSTGIDFMKHCFDAVRPKICSTFFGVTEGDLNQKMVLHFLDADAFSLQNSPEEDFGETYDDERERLLGEILKDLERNLRSQREYGISPVFFDIDLKAKRSATHWKLDRLLDILEDGLDFTLSVYPSLRESFEKKRKSESSGQSFPFDTYLRDLAAYRITKYFRSIWKSRAKRVSVLGKGADMYSDPDDAAYDHAYYVLGGKKCQLYSSTNGWKKKTSSNMSFEEIVRSRITTLFPVDGNSAIEKLE